MNAATAVDEKPVEIQNDVDTNSEICVYTPEDIARVLQVPDRTVLRLLRAGAIKSVRVGAKFRIPKRYLEEYLHNQAEEERG